MDEYSMDYSGKFNGRTFFQNGNQWTDARIQKAEQVGPFSLRF